MNRDEQKDNDNFQLENLASLLDWTNEILPSSDLDNHSHCPIMASVEPADMTKQEKESFQTDAGRKERADRRKAEAKSRKESEG